MRQGGKPSCFLIRKAALFLSYPALFWCTTMAYSGTSINNYYSDLYRCAGLVEGQPIPDTLNVFGETISVEELKKAIRKLKGGDTMSNYYLANKTYDDDIKALIKVGVLNKDLSINDAQMVLQHYIFRHLKQLGAEARKMLEERKERGDTNE